MQKPKKGNKHDSTIKQKPLEGWIQDITTSAWDGTGSLDAVTSASFEYSNGSLTSVENFDFVYRQLGFKRIKLVNVEADGHVVVQVMESSFKLYERAEFKYDESKPATDVSVCFHLTTLSSSPRATRSTHDSLTSGGSHTDFINLSFWFQLRAHRYYFAKVDTKELTYGNRAEYRGDSRRAGNAMMYFTDIGQTVSLPKKHVYEIENYADAARIPAQVSGVRTSETHEFL